MNTTEIRPLIGVNFEQLHLAFSSAFADYAEPFDKTVEELAYMLGRRGYAPEFSFGAFYKEALVCFILNGAGAWNGQATAYDTGTGTVKEFRKQGLASKVLKETITALRQNNVTQYLLEAIRINTNAIDLYRGAGFETTRELDYYIAQKNAIAINERTALTGYTVKEIVPDWELFETFWSIGPSWQNSIDSITRKQVYFTFLGIFDNDKLAGYGIIERHTGDIPQFAISEEYRGAGVGRMLFYEMLDYADTQVIKLINYDAAYMPFRQFMQSLNIWPGHGQYEMMLKL